MEKKWVESLCFGNMETIHYRSSLSGVSPSIVPDPGVVGGGERISVRTWTGMFPLSGGFKLHEGRSNVSGYIQNVYIELWELSLKKCSGKIGGCRDYDNLMPVGFDVGLNDIDSQLMARVIVFSWENNTNSQSAKIIRNQIPREFEMSRISFSFLRKFKFSVNLKYSAK